MIYSLNSNLELMECASEIINWLLRNDLLVNKLLTFIFNIYNNFKNIL